MKRSWIAFLVSSLVLTQAQAQDPNPTPTPALSTQATSAQTGAASPTSPQTLSQAFAASLKRSESINIQQEILIQTEELTRQSRGTFLPTVSGSGVWSHQVTPTNSEISGPTDQRTTKLTGDLSLFNGLKDLSTLRQRKYLVKSQDAAFKNAAKQLFYDLSTAYYNVLMAQSDLRNYKNEIEMNLKRIEELKHFVKIGRSRDTDLLTFQANVSALEVQVESTLGQLEAAKDILAFLTGWNRETPLQDSENGNMPGTLAEGLSQIENRPDVVSALASAQAAQEGVPAARAGHLPTLDLVGDNYFDRPYQPSGGPDWDVQLVLSVPLYEGGIVQSQVRQAQSISRQNELTLSQTRRSAEQEIRTYFDGYNSDYKQIPKLEDEVKWSKKNYEAELRDYRNGLVTNLDVLTALTTFQDAQRLLDRQRFMVHEDVVKFQAATARRNEINIMADTDEDHAEDTVKQMHETQVKKDE